MNDDRPSHRMPTPEALWARARAFEDAADLAEELIRGSRTEEIAPTLRMLAEVCARRARELKQ